MEQITLDRKQIRKVMLVYGIIVALVNLVGFLLANSGGMPIAETENYSGWLAFMDTHKNLIAVLNVVEFAIPVFLIFWYRYIVVNKANERIINLPFVFAAIGSSGPYLVWIPFQWL